MELKGTGTGFMEQIKGALYLTGAFVLAGSSVVSARIVSGSLGTFTIAAVSLFFASLCLIPFCGRRLAVRVRKMKRKDWIAVILQALFGIFLFRFFLLRGLVRTSTGEAGILTGATPAITALLAYLILKEPLFKARVAGLCATVAGILLVQGFLLPGGGFHSSHLIGNLLVLCAATCESLFNVLSKIGFLSASERGDTADPLLQTALVSMIAFLFCLVPAILENPFLPLYRLNIVQWLSLVWYGAVVTALAFFFWYAGIKRCEASVAAVFSGMMPFTALLLSVLLLGERPAFLQYLGGLLIVAGMIVSGIKKESVRQLVSKENSDPLTQPVEHAVWKSCGESLRQSE